MSRQLKHSYIRLWTCHWLNDDPELLDRAYVIKRSSVSAANFLREYIAGECSHVVVAYDSGLIGFFRCSVVAAGGVNTLMAKGTHVSMEYRKEGLAGLLWSTAIERLGVHEVEVNTVSLGGQKLISSVRRNHRHIRVNPY